MCIRDRCVCARARALKRIRLKIKYMMSNKCILVLQFPKQFPGKNKSHAYQAIIYNSVAMSLLIQLRTYRTCAQT